MHKRTMIIFMMICFLVFPISTRALSPSLVQVGACEDTLLGSPTDENSIAWIVQQILDAIKIVGPVLVLVLSSLDFAKVILSGDDQDMAKAQKKLITRVLLAGALFLLPFLVSFLLDLFGLTSSGTCGIS